MPGIESSFCRGIGLQRRQGGNLFRPRKVFSGAGPPKQGSTGKTCQDKPTQAKGSRRGQMAFTESGWGLAHTLVVGLADPAKV